MPNYKSSIGEKIFKVFNAVFFTVFTILCIFPFYYLFINTISDNSLVMAGMINLVPRGIHFSNYTALLNVRELGQSTIVTIGRTVLGTTLTVLASAFVGYLVTKNAMLGRKIVYRFIIATMFFNAGLIPWFMNISMLGLTNTFAGYIIPAIVAPFNIILVKTYVESLPAEMEESAFMDGAGYMRVFINLVLPLSKPILATIAVFAAVGHWNSFMDSIILMGSAPNLWTLMHRLHIYLNTTSNLGVLMQGGRLTDQQIAQALNNRVISLTVAMAITLPILFVYPFAQKYFQKGLMLGAVKG